MRNRSPRRQTLHQELDEHTARVKDILLGDIKNLEQENALLKAKCKKVNELDDKIQQVLRQNGVLLNENQRMSRLIHQLRSQNESVKAKHQITASQRYSYATEFEFEKKKLLSQIEHLSMELKQIQSLKNAQIAELKGQYQVEIQALRRQGGSTHQLYQQELRKLRQQLDKKENEIIDYSNSIKRANADAQYEILRLKEDKEKMRQQLQYMEMDRKKELESMKNKLDMNYREEIESIKMAHLTAMEDLSAEHNKVIMNLEERTQDTEQLSVKLAKQRDYFEQSMALLRKENQSLRFRLVEREKLTEQEKTELKMKLAQLHESELNEINSTHQKYIDCLQAELSKLEGANASKHQQIEQLVKDKANARTVYENQIKRLKENVDGLWAQLKDSEQKASSQNQQGQHKQKELRNQIDYLDSLNRTQTQNHHKELDALRALLQQQKNDLQTERIRNRETEQAQREAISQLKNENATLRQACRREREDKQKALQEIKNELHGTSSNLRGKVDSLSSKNSIVQRENETLKANIMLKEKEIGALQEKLRASQERERRLEREIDQLRSKMIRKDQKSNEMMTEQKNRLESAYSFTTQSMKADHAAAMKLEANKIADLQSRLAKKERELQQLLRLYKRMSEEFTTLSEQEANRKEMTLKYPGASSEIIATKNLFDVFLKTKILDVCGDAMKENLR